MVVEDIVVRVRQDVSEIKDLVNLREDIKKTGRAGRDTGRQIGFVDSRLNKLGVDAKRVSSVFGRFNFEMLSVMFFGAAISQTFKGLIGPTADLFGVMDVLNTTLAVGLLPTGQKLMDFALGFMDIFLNLPEPVREVIGDFAVLAVGLGTLLAVVGATSLGVKGLAIAFGTSMGVIFAVLGIFGLIAASLFGLIALWQNWNRISGKTKLMLALIVALVGSLLLPLSATVGVILLVVAGLIGLIAVIKNWGRMTEWIRSKWEGLKTWFKNTKFGQIFIKWVDRMKMAWQGFIDFVKRLWESIKSIFGRVIGAVGRGRVNVSGTRQVGGFIPHTGLYRLHAGEQVVPANQNLNFSPTITVTASSNVDIDNMAERISNRFIGEIERLRR